MAKRSKTSGGSPVQIEQNDHRTQTRLNNPPIGLVDENEAVGTVKKEYAYDPHIDPSLQWAGKAERTSFEVPTVSLHTHEHIDARHVMKAVRKRGLGVQGDLFAQPDLPLGEALEFYKHAQNWQNRLIAGDSLLVMNSLLEKEAMAGSVQMIYFDPPYGIKYKSNFQPFTDKRDLKDTDRDEDLSSEPEMIKAFRDTWQLGIHSYLTYLRDRLQLAKDLLAESGSIFVQISEENVHRVRCIMDEVFGAENFVSMVSFQTTTGFETKTISRMGDYLLWYAKAKSKIKFVTLFQEQKLVIGEGNARWILLPDGTYRGVTSEEKNGNIKLPEGSKFYKPDNLLSQGGASQDQTFEFQGKKYTPPSNSHWKANFPEGMDLLAQAGRIHVAKNSIQYIRFADDFPFQTIGNIWTDTTTGSFTNEKTYVVQTNQKVIARCLLMTTSPGDLVLDITCGSGTTAYVAEQWGRRWITCDTSRIAIALAKQRLMAAAFPYYRLRAENEGVAGDFMYETVPHIKLENIAKNEPTPMETLYDKPLVDKKRMRVCSPFTVEAVPSAVAASPDDTSLYRSSDQSFGEAGEAPSSYRTAATRLQTLLDELMSKGIRGKNGQRICFQNLEVLATAAGDADLNISHVHARAEEKPESGEAGALYAIVIGNEYTPMDKTWLDKAMTQAFNLRPKVQKVLFLAYQFDAGVHEYVEKSSWGGLGIILAQIDSDLLVEDLKKKQKGDSFWLIGQPDVRLRAITEGEHKGKYTVEVRGFDYYNVAEQRLESGGKGDIAMWLLDPDYNDRFLHPAQIFFPMADAKSGWASLAKTLAAELDQELIEAYRGTESLPFELGEHRQVAVKVIDKRGVESVRILKP
ncbi:MAG: site-specific DNA-methyltransferase [Saprospiraceae bacterium]|nr:site-specific DNA-methyltransferase [Saprospiraceae bacterium]